ncbi:hypothetical protein ATANTOWER_002146 [Ataeniobius toweri]|uniref:Uncharacterized protein n=1 Tax=Ataeniobius toweri TaxID=208326 RepID=A0ABU7B524_9TELE|nr:hypothetical protein [Ataeniobius toweri]
MLFCSSDRSKGSRDEAFHRRSLFSLKVTAPATFRGRTLGRYKMHIVTLHVFINRFQPMMMMMMLLQEQKRLAGELLTHLLWSKTTGCDDKLALTEYWSD